MGSSQIIVWVVGAALLFWVVGAYNRLVRLRGDLVRAFAPVGEQFKQRHGLLMQ
jgi:LemA protein